jgi:hypothetical protein
MIHKGSIRATLIFSGHPLKATFESTDIMGDFARWI